jgi:hypothetical protein
VAGRAGAALAIASSLPTHVFPGQVFRSSTPRLCAAGAGGVTTVTRCASAATCSYGQQLELAEGSLPRGLPCHCADKAGNICSAPLCICRVALLLLNVFPWQGRRWPTPSFCAAGAGGVTTVERFASAAVKHAEVSLRLRRRHNNCFKMRQRYSEATTNDSNSPKVQRREGYFTTV